MSAPAFDYEYYQIFRPSMKTWFSNRRRTTTEDINRAIAEFAASQGCHIIASFIFYEEIYGKDSNTQANIDRLCTFYHFSGLLGKGASE